MLGIVEGVAMQDCKDHDILTATTTVGSLDDARRLAREIVDRQLAACVQLEPIALSVYRWEGRLFEEPEVRLTMKTAPGKLEALRSFVHESHPYDLPQFTVARHEASEAYARWVRAEVGVERDGAR
jgi:periplasmic divalent cation tolerance protein